MIKKKILFISNHASFFFSHRINIFREAKKKKIGFKLIFGNAASPKMEKFAIKNFKNENLDYHKFNYSHNRLSITQDISSIFKIIKIIKMYKPNIIHSASPKANFLASIIINFCSVEKIVISISGLGYLFTEKKNIFGLIKGKIFLTILKYCLNNKKKKIIVQNKDDYYFIKLALKLKNNEIQLIEGGSGIEYEKYKKIKKISSKNVTMVSRIVINKGVKEFLKSAILLKKKYPDWNFFLIGSRDYNSMDNVKQDFFKKNDIKKYVNVIDYEPNITNYLKKTEIFCLPSYREGMPKSILEALGFGIPVVTTNVIGCKDSIIDGYNGLLCRPKDHIDLAKKIEILILSKKFRKRLGLNGKNFAKKKLSIKIVTKKIFKTYE